MKPNEKQPAGLNIKAIADYEKQVALNAEMEAELSAMVKQSDVLDETLYSLNKELKAERPIVGNTKDEVISCMESNKSLETELKSKIAIIEENKSQLDQQIADKKTVCYAGKRILRRINQSGWTEVICHEIESIRPALDKIRLLMPLVELNEGELFGYIFANYPQINFDTDFVELKRQYPALMIV